MSPDPFKVIVIGGGPAGLITAHALHLAGIDFVVLERRRAILEDVGASLVLTAPSMRVMHQLGILDDLLDIGHEVLHNRTFDVDGNVLGDTRALEVLRTNHGMAPVAFHRAQLVETIYNGLPASAMSRVLPGKNLLGIQSDEEGVTVTCEDGSSYRGSIVVGADGVHSKTRRMMRKLALEADPSRPWDPEVPFEAVYRCMWCSFPRPSESGQSFETQHKDRSVMYITGKDLGWIFLYEKLPEPARGRASYTESDIEAYVEKFKEFPVTDDLKVKDVWAKRQNVGMGNLEEGLATNWSWGRIVLLGDAAHKFTPNAGRGLNTAVQDVVTLCNGLHGLQDRLSSPTSPSSKEEFSLLTEAFEKYEAQRKPLLAGDASQSALIARAQAWANPLYYFTARYVLSAKFVQWLLFGVVMKWAIKKALVLDYVDVDERMKGVVPWDHPLNGTLKKAV